MCPFDYTTFAVSRKVGIPLTGFNNTSWVAIVTPTDRPKSVRNRSVIEAFGGLFVLSSSFYDFSVGVGSFEIALPFSLKSGS